MGDKYNPLFELGAGSFGKAWVVKDTKTQKKYVSKVIQIKGLSSEALDRCVTEVAVLSACCHENIVRYLEAFVSNGALHIVMEYASGGDLQQKIEKQNGVLFTSDKILEWFLQVILALEYIHSKNILHRDLKPQNIFLTDIGVVKLGDFGIARVLNSCDDLASTRIGTPFYISPEICERKPYNSCSDMWAAGCLLYQMSMLRVPFHATNFDDLCKNIIKAQYDPIPSQFQGIIKDLISKLLVSTPEHRLSASQLLRLESLRDIVLYLKSRNRRKGQSSRIRSNSLVTERSRLNLCSKSRSSSVNRLNRESVGNGEVMFGKQHQDKYKGSDDVNIRNKNVPTDKNRICKSNVEGGSEQHYSRGDENCFRIDRDRITEKHDGEANINGAEKLAYVNPSISRRNIRSVSDDAVGTKAVEKSNNKVEDEKELNLTKKPINTKTYAIKDSVVKRLSQASPILAQTVRKQRFSLSISEADSSLKMVGNKNAN
ncbi:serine/threonine-protein kinase Nek1-like [Ruditapes philippinarum]|uniref:serine/threonine-protein kinase Nek1-like n=1 Tax=Ruditapes philippinarum TaxID=129788 RepID=UPI00295BFFE3|nr:serine/threonine-protein kinase Nek1-like [Ruditapes philippinarum]